MNSRRKGKRGELEARDLVREHWHSPKCIRSAQVSGKYAADLLEGPPGLHLEVKLVSKIGAMKYYRQAEDDAKSNEVPVVLMRENDGPWMVMFTAESLGLVVDAWNKARLKKMGLTRVEHGCFRGDLGESG